MFIKICEHKQFIDACLACKCNLECDVICIKFSVYSISTVRMFHVCCGDDCAMAFGYGLVVAVLVRNPLRSYSLDIFMHLFRHVCVDAAAWAGRRFFKRLHVLILYLAGQTRFSQSLFRVKIRLYLDRLRLTFVLRPRSWCTTLASPRQTLYPGPGEGCRPAPVKNHTHPYIYLIMRIQVWSFHACYEPL